jgi:hypothetical protein
MESHNFHVVFIPNLEAVAKTAAGVTLNAVISRLSPFGTLIAFL